MWTVTTERIAGKVSYYLENSETGERLKTHDCERWARQSANELNEKELDTGKKAYGWRE